MPTLTFNTGFEHGVGESGKESHGKLASPSLVFPQRPLYYDFTDGGGSSGPCVLQAGSARSGAYGLNVSSGSKGVGWAELEHTTHQTNVGVYRVYFRFVGSVPDDGKVIFRARDLNRAYDIRIAYDSTSGCGEVWIGGVAQGVGSTVLSAGTWYRLDVRWTATSATHTVDWQINGVAQTSRSAGGLTGTDPRSVQLGHGLGGGSATYNVDFDDLAVSATSSDYPLGPGVGGLLLPSSLALHSVGTFVQSGTQNAITTGDWALVDEIPMDEITTYIRQTVGSSDLTNGHPTIGFSNTDGRPINGVQAIAAYAAESTSANTMRMWARANSVDTYLHGSSSTQPTVGVDRDLATRAFSTMQVDNGGVAWTDAMLDNTVIRFGTGAGTDASPAPDWFNFALEVDYSSAIERTISAWGLEGQAFSSGGQLATSDWS